jgi:hypothetical protein
MSGARATDSVRIVPRAKGPDFHVHDLRDAHDDTHLGTVYVGLHPATSDRTIIAMEECAPFRITWLRSPQGRLEALVSQSDARSFVHVIVDENQLAATALRAFEVLHAGTGGRCSARPPVWP